MRGVFTLAAGCLIAVVTGMPARTDEPRPDTLKAQDVLERLAEVYAGCKKYRDTGVVKTAFVEATGSWAVEKPFNTAFVRPDRFRFQHVETGCGPDHRFTVWPKGDEVRVWWTVKPRFEKRDSLELALAAATGVSGGSAHTVPALPLPNEIGGRRLTDIAAATRAEDATIDTVNYLWLSRSVWFDPLGDTLRAVSGSGMGEAAQADHHDECRESWELERHSRTSGRERTRFPRRFPVSAGRDARLRPVGHPRSCQALKAEARGFPRVVRHIHECRSNPPQGRLAEA